MAGVQYRSKVLELRPFPKNTNTNCRKLIVRHSFLPSTRFCRDRMCFFLKRLRASESTMNVATTGSATGKERNVWHRVTRNTTIVFRRRIAVCRVGFVGRRVGTGFSVCHLLVAAAAGVHGGKCDSVNIATRMYNNERVTVIIPVGHWRQAKRPESNGLFVSHTPKLY